MAEAEELQVVVARVHLFNNPLESLRSLLRIRNNRCEQMRNASVCRKLYSLRIYQNHTNLFRCCSHDNRSEHRVNKTRLTRSCSTCNKQMRHFIESCRYEMTLNILTNTCKHRVWILARFIRPKNISQIYNLSIYIRDLNTNCRLARNWRENTHISTCYSIRNILLKIRYLLYFYSRS
ncbi:Uncharacterised protein [Chlamydia trachomatis]|nr:Uncharacterised protein [Chlamydia trachomatis]